MFVSNVVVFVLGNPLGGDPFEFRGRSYGHRKIVQVSKPKLCQRMILREEEMKHRFPAN